VTHRRPLRALALTIYAFGATALTACGLDYGADFDYPSEPPLPPGATVITHAKGWDDDDPMRGREVVIDMGSARPTELVEFYDQRFPSSEGWLPGAPDPDVGGGHVVCLVSHADKRFDEYVEVYPTHGSQEPTGTHQYVVSISRLFVASEGDDRTVNRCGLAGNWYPINP